jgi:hypothetical protein
MTTPVTSPGRIPIPTLQKEPNIPADLLAAATDLDFKVENRFASVGDRDAYLPAAAAAIGVRCLVLTTGRRYVVWPTTTGNAWFEVRGASLVAANVAARDTLLTTPDGMHVLDDSTGITYVRAGTVWTSTGQVPETYAVTYANGVVDFATAGWRLLRVYKLGRVCWTEGLYQGTASTGSATIAQNGALVIGSVPTVCAPVAIDKAVVTVWAPNNAIGYLMIGTDRNLTLTPVTAAAAAGWNGSSNGLRWQAAA